MSLGRKIAWSTGSVGSMVSMYSFSAFVYFYYIQYLRVDPGLVGRAMMGFAIWNALNDPLFGHWSDRTRTRWGRRKFYIALGIVPLALVYAVQWMAPESIADWSPLLTTAYIMGMVCLFDAFYTMVFLNWTALYPEMFMTLKERVQMAVTRQAFGVVGLAVGIALPPMLYGSGSGNAAGWGQMGILFGFVIVLTGLISLAGSKERPEFLNDPPLKFYEAVKMSLNPSFITFGVANMAINFAFVMLTGVYPFFTQHVLGVDGVQAALLQGAAFITMLLTLPVWASLAMKRTPRTALSMASGLLAVTTLPFIFATEYWHGLAASLLVGTALSGLVAIPDILIADIIDEDEVRTGCRREGMYFGLNGFFVRVGVAVQAGVMTMVMARTGFSANLTRQTPEAIQGLRMLLSPVVMAVLLIAIMMMWAYPLHGRRLKDIQNQLDSLHRRKSSGIPM